MKKILFLSLLSVYVMDVVASDLTQGGSRLELSKVAIEEPERLHPDHAAFLIRHFHNSHPNSTYGMNKDRENLAYLNAINVLNGNKDKKYNELLSIYEKYLERWDQRKDYNFLSFLQKERLKEHNERLKCRTRDAYNSTPWNPRPRSRWE